MDKSMKKKMPKRSKASYTTPRVKSDKMGSYKYSEEPSNLMKTSTDDGKMSRADTELKRLVGGDVFRSASKTVKQTNSNPRRVR